MKNSKKNQYGEAGAVLDEVYKNISPIMIGKQEFIERSKMAIEAACDEFVTWPDKEKCRTLCKKMEEGIMDELFRERNSVNIEAMELMSLLACQLEKVSMKMFSKEIIYDNFKAGFKYVGEIRDYYIRYSNEEQEKIDNARNKLFDEIETNADSEAKEKAKNYAEITEALQKIPDLNLDKKRIQGVFAAVIR